MALALHFFDIFTLDDSGAFRGSATGCGPTTGGLIGVFGMGMNPEAGTRAELAIGVVYMFLFTIVFGSSFDCFT